MPVYLATPIILSIISCYLHFWNSPASHYIQSLSGLLSVAERPPLCLFKNTFSAQVSQTLFLLLANKDLTDTAFQRMCRSGILKTPDKRPIIHLTVLGIATTHMCLWEAPSSSVCCVSDEEPTEGLSPHLSPATKRDPIFFIHFIWRTIWAGNRSNNNKSLSPDFLVDSTHFCGSWLKIMSKPAGE